MTEHSEQQAPVSPTTRARAFLRAMLHAEAYPARAIMAEAARQHIPTWALRKAKQREGVRSNRTGFGPGSWVMWEYPHWRKVVLGTGL